MAPADQAAPETGSDTLRVGLIGAGMITHYHLIAWSRAVGADVVAICDPVRARAEDRARTFSIPAVYETSEALLVEQHLFVVKHPVLILAPSDAWSCCRFARETRCPGRPRPSHRSIGGSTRPRSGRTS